MTTPKLKAVSDQPPDIWHLKLTGKLEGQWVDVKRELTGRQTMVLLRSEEDFASVIEVIGQITVAHSFEGDILDQPLPTIFQILRLRTRHEEDAVLDPTPASD